MNSILRLILRGVLDWNDAYGICKYIPLDLKHTGGAKHHDIYMLTSDYARADIQPIWTFTVDVNR
jgi:hypothetical protein